MQSQEPNLRAGLLEVPQDSQAEDDGQGEGEADVTDSQVQELEAMMLKMQAVKGILCPVSSSLCLPLPRFSCQILCRTPVPGVSVSSDDYVQLFLFSIENDNLKKLS